MPFGPLTWHCRKNGSSSRTLPSSTLWRLLAYLPFEPFLLAASLLLRTLARSPLLSSSFSIASTIAPPGCKCPRVCTRLSGLHVTDFLRRTLRRMTVEGPRGPRICLALLDCVASLFEGEEASEQGRAFDIGCVHVNAFCTYRPTLSASCPDC